MLFLNPINPLEGILNSGAARSPFGSMMVSSPFLWVGHFDYFTGSLFRNVHYQGFDRLAWRRRQFL
jgi:hypothetical protein